MAYFKNSKATEIFLISLDIFNNSSRYAVYEWKRALSPKNQTSVFDQLQEIKDFILKLEYGGKVLINIESLKGLYNLYVKPENSCV